MNWKVVQIQEFGKTNLLFKKFKIFNIPPLIYAIYIIHGSHVFCYCVTFHGINQFLVSLIDCENGCNCWLMRGDYAPHRSSNNRTDERGIYFIGWVIIWEMKGDYKGLEIQRLIGSAVAGFIHAMTITKASAKGLDTRQDDYNKGIYSPGSLVNSPVR